MDQQDKITALGVDPISRVIVYHEVKESRHMLLNLTSGETKVFYRILDKLVL